MVGRHTTKLFDYSAEPRFKRKQPHTKNQGYSEMIDIAWYLFMKCVCKWLHIKSIISDSNVWWILASSATERLILCFEAFSRTQWPINDDINLSDIIILVVKLSYWIQPIWLLYQLHYYVANDQMSTFKTQHIDSQQFQIL